MTRIREATGTEQSVAALVKRQLSSSSIDKWRILALGKMSPTEFSRWVTIKNIAAVRAALDAGTGVLLVNTHISMNRIMPVVIAREGLALTSLEADDYYAGSGVPGLEQNESITIRGDDGFYLKALMRAKKTLKSGRILLMAPDGLQGMGSGNEYEFLQRKRPFFASFATLAEQTGARVFIGNFNLADNGHLDVEFIPCDTNADSAVTGRADMIVGNYIRHLESVWKQDPGVVQAKHLAYYLNLKS